MTEDYLFRHKHIISLEDLSRDDIAMTRQMVEAGRILGISVLDHIIITRKGYLSFKKEGLID